MVIIMARIAVILVLPIEYNTSSMLRSRSIITSLIEMGHTVKCYCPYPDINNKYFSSKTKIPEMELFRFGRKAWSGMKERLEQKRVFSFRCTATRFGLRLFRKFDVFGSTLLYLPERKRISEDIAKGSFDILLSFSDPMPAHMIAKYCKQRNPQLRYIQQWGDPLASDTIGKTAQPVWIRKRIEAVLLQPAEKICYVSPFTCGEQKKIFPKQADKMFFLPTPSLKYEETKDISDGLCIGYFGSYYSTARNLKPFYEAAKNNPAAKFLIIGDSDLKLESTENIMVIGRIPHDELNAYMQKIDVIVCLMNSRGNQIPGKVYHDASTTKDILFIKDGEYGDAIETFFDKYNHYTFAENTEESIDAAIKRYISEGVPVRRPVQDFQPLSVAKKLIE